MKILVLSDSHGFEKSLCEILKNNANSCDMIIHLGDGCSDMQYMREYTGNKPVCVLKGNCDYGFAGEPERITTKAEGKTIFACHGHRYNVKEQYRSPTTLHYAALEENADICLYGHTHIQRLDEIDGMVILNPGAAKNGEYAIIGIKDGKIQVELY